MLGYTNPAYDPKIDSPLSVNKLPYGTVGRMTLVGRTETVNIRRS